MGSGKRRRFELVEIGRVKNDYLEEIPDDYKENLSKIEVYERYEDALLGIEKNSHISVLCWFDRSAKDIQRVHPMADESNPLTGVFATRAPVRPNPISYTVCELVNREGNTLQVKGLDALNETPVIDIKSYKRYEIEELEFPDWVPE
ncbi:MAG: tRNA (N6-threonylcarbamoyladenosine(37)-N6)-methyltransferase TrmO [Candidatus Thermoplasmatota archaeon]|nr:tRNA (N6-threonylcarbamoyladenosine(37)-N6)-methyltransferase TrmO [Candidatus Thermoplasmatota archaeon]MBS3790867.1 tRNA (N6-threonylcarbamoyladenosine(37)-N6)-methyltransferase TrmO [Candidatus Thermoplasmatota archaeon]